MTRPNFFIAFLLSTAFVTQHAVADGWTTFAPEDGQKIVYVSNGGEDPGEGSNPGVVYLWDESNPPTDIGGEPFEPNNVKPFKTITAAYDALTNNWPTGGSPGWVLLKRGDDFANQDFGQNNNFHKFGPSSGDGWLLFGAYKDFSDPSDDRPIVARINSSTTASIDDPFHHLAIVSLQLVGESGGGIRIVRNGSGLHIEDVLITPGNGHGISIEPQHDDPDGEVVDVVVRRNVVFGRGQTSSSGGIFVNNVNGLLVEDNVFWHNGWIDETCPWPTTFNCPPASEPAGTRQNMYLSCGNSNVTTRNNISADASYAGCQQRSDGVNENNLYLRNGIGLQIGFTNDACDWDEGDFGSALAHNNVIIDSARSGVGGSGHGLVAAHTKGAVFDRNLVVHKTDANGGGGGGLMVTRHAVDTVFQNNIVYDWAITTGSTDSRSVDIQCTDLTAQPSCNVYDRSVLFYNNHLQQPSGGLLVWHHPLIAGGHVFEETVYHSSTNDPFLIESGNCCSSHHAEDWTYWLNFLSADEDGGQLSDLSSTYPEPSRNIGSYMDDVLSITPGSDPITEFMLLAIQQSKTNWNPELTAAAVNCYMRGGFDMIEPCPADIDSLGGSGPDGEVDIFDLLALLGCWGTPTPPNCDDADIDSDGDVDVFDLLLLLGSWGDCASCVPDEREAEIDDCLDRYEPGTTELRECLEYVRDYGEFFHHYEEEY